MLHGRCTHKRGVRACTRQGEGEGMQAHLRPSGRIAQWRGAQKHLIEDGVACGGECCTNVACQKKKPPPQRCKMCQGWEGQMM